MATEIPKGLAVEDDGKVIGFIKSYQQYAGNLPTISVQIIDWDAFDEILEAMKRGY